MKLKNMFATWGLMAVVAIVLNLALLTAAIWIVVKMLRWMGVIQ